VRARTKYLFFLGLIIDYNVQVHADKENATDVAIKERAHGVISAACDVAEFAVGGPVGAALVR